MPYVVAEEGRDIVDALRQAEIPAVTGDLVDPATLIQAHIARAGALVITLTDSLRIQQMTDVARQLNPDIHVVACAASEGEARLMREQLDIEVFTADGALAHGLANQTLSWVSVRPEGHFRSTLH